MLSRSTTFLNMIVNIYITLPCLFLVTLFNLRAARIMFTLKMEDSPDQCGAQKVVLISLENLSGILPFDIFDTTFFQESLPFLF